MSNTRPPARVRWTLELLPGSNIVRAVCVDSGSDQRLDLNLPADSIPGLLRGLEELLNAHAERFPVILQEIVK